jgi:hypothetical protein
VQALVSEAIALSPAAAKDEARGKLLIRGVSAKQRPQANGECCQASEREAHARRTLESGVGRQGTQPLEASFHARSEFSTLEASFHARSEFSSPEGPFVPKLFVPNTASPAAPSTAKGSTAKGSTAKGSSPKRSSRSTCAPS